MAKVVLSDDFADALHAAGVIPDPSNVRRVVIDLQAGEMPVAHIETWLDSSAIDVVRTLEGVQIRREPKAD